MKKHTQKQTHKHTIRYTLIFCILIASMMLSACGNSSNTSGKVQEGGTYANEELKFSFQIPGDMGEYYKVSEDDWVHDDDLDLDRRTIHFSMKYPQGEALMFNINVYDGKFDEEFLSRSNPMMKYLAYKNNYTYTVDYAGEAPEKMRKDKAYLNLYNDYMNEYMARIADYITYENDTSNENSETEDITVNIEGNRETVTVKKYKSDLGFTIGYDENFMTPERVDDVEYICATEYMHKEGKPEVYLSIVKMGSVPFDDAVADAVEKNQYQGDVKEITIGKDYDTAKTFTISEGSDSGSRVVEFYIVDHNDETYTIQIDYINQVAEGLGARLHALLYTLKFN